ncbi:MAG: FecR family protein [Lachnospiraceae bacterium]|nr:FecR family protein [Lachnospiraceae bacterium]
MASEGKAGSKKLIFIILAAVIVIAAIVVIIFLRKGGISATTMRLLRMQGTVTLEDEGAHKTITENLRLKSGNALNTGTESLASIGLDDTKIITLDELSRAEFNQNGKKLDLELTEGQLFFEVSKALEADESLNIATSTMVVGIRGTSGWVTVTKDGNWSIVVTDGHVHVTGTNPETGETKETEVYAGQRCIVYLYDRETDSVMFTLEDVSEDEIPEFVLAILRSNPALLDKVCEATGWSKPVILGETEDETGDNGNGESSQNTQPGSGSGDEGNTGNDDGNDDGNGDETGQAEEEEETVKVAGTAKERVQEYIAYEYPTSGNILVTNGDLFDPAYYANRYPDVASAVGNDKYALLEHYLQFGEKEGRSPNQLDEETKLAELYAAEHPDTGNNNSGSNNANQNNQRVWNSGSVLTNNNGTVTDANGNTVGTMGVDMFTVGSGTYTLPLTVVNGNGQGQDWTMPSLGTFKVTQGSVVNVDATNQNNSGPMNALPIMVDAGNGSTITSSTATYTKSASGDVTVATTNADCVAESFAASGTKPSTFNINYNGTNIGISPSNSGGGLSDVTINGVIVAEVETSHQNQAGYGTVNDQTHGWGAQIPKAAGGYLTIYEDGTYTNT